MAEALAAREEDTIPPAIDLSTGRQSQQNSVDQLQLEHFAAGLSELTPKEHAIFQCYVVGKTTTEIIWKGSYL